MEADIDKTAVENLQTQRDLLRDYALSEETPEAIRDELLEAHAHIEDATYKAERELWNPPLGTE